MLHLDFKSHHGAWPLKVIYLRIRTENTTIFFQLYENTDETITQCGNSLTGNRCKPAEGDRLQLCLGLGQQAVSQATQTLQPLTGKLRSASIDAAVRSDSQRRLGISANNFERC